jgi:serine/threonine-protein kinase/endoribonuclease IRE1
MPDEIERLYQMVSGLKFIHKKKMIHRDIKPENILISVLDGSARLKISDFGFTKPLKEDGFHYDLASGLKGTEFYMAPELLFLRDSKGSVLDKECTIATDVFAAGCTFFRYLNGGLHPFGKGFDIEVNIMKGKPINATSKKIITLCDFYKVVIHEAISTC